MPIKGLTDERLAFPQIGVIRKGAPKEGNRPGKDLNYFRVVFDDQETEAAQKFRQVYGDQPQEINVLLPFDDLDRVWEAWLEAYTAGRMVARADGEKFIYLLDTETNEVVVRGGVDLRTGQPRPYVEGQPVGYYTDKHGRRQPIYCKPVGRLKVVIPELRRLAYLLVVTTSIHDIMNLDAQLKALHQVNGGRIAGIPLVLRRRPKKVSVPKPDGTRARMTKWLLSIEADERWVQQAVAALAAKARPMLTAGEVRALPDHAEEEVAEVMEGEFVPVGETDPKGAENGAKGRETAHNGAESAPKGQKTVPNGPENGSNGHQNGTQRPYAPEALKAAIQRAVAHFEAHPPEGDQQGRKGLIVALLEAVLGDATARYEFSDWLLGKPSSKEWTDAEVAALWRWLEPWKDQESGLWMVKPEAEQEARWAHRAALEAKGQQALAM